MAWEPGTLEPLFKQLIPTLEAATTAQIAGRAVKARLPRALVAEIEKDAAWNAPAKKAIEIAAPQVAAKWLNKSGISADNQPEIVLGTAVASLLASQVMLLRRLDALIAAVNAPTASPDPAAHQKPAAPPEPAKS